MGTAFLLKAGDGLDPPGFYTIAGMKAQKLLISGEAVAAPVESGQWKSLLGGAGTRSVSISAAGIFTGSEAEKQVRAAALSGSIESYELSFESGERLRGSFIVMSLEYVGDFNGERNYTLALESSGEVVSL